MMVWGDEVAYLGESDDDLIDTQARRGATCISRFRVSQPTVTCTVVGGHPAHPRCDHGMTFSATILTVVGKQHRLDGLIPSEFLSSLRCRVASEIGLPVPLVHLCFGTRALKAEDNVLTLHELGIAQGAVLTCVRALGAALGQGRYALTNRRVRCSDDMLDAVRSEYGEEALVADFAAVSHTERGELCRFLDSVGFHGSAFVLDNGRCNFGDARAGHFFACRHSGNIPVHWLVRPLPITDEDYGINCLDLCWKVGSVMPVLVDLGPA